MDRYSVIETKRKREIVLLRGRGCVYRKCAFCDYHVDCCADDDSNFELNRSVLDCVRGVYGELEVINSGSVFELDDCTLDYIAEVCRLREISVIHFEAHYLFAPRIPELRKRFSGFTLKLKLGLETFDYDFRERVLLKGIPERDPEVIARRFDEANLLFGICGQTVETMRRDIELALGLFERICINIMCPNTTFIVPDAFVISEFMRELYPVYMDDERVDILINNTDFGVGDLS